VFDLGHLSPSIRWRRAGGGGVSPAFQTDFTAISSLPTGISLTRATTGTYFNASGVLQTAAIDAPRFDHNPVSPFAATGLLIEEQRTNLILQSGNLADPAWSTNSNVTSPVITANAATAPDGTTTAAQVVFSAVTDAGTYSSRYQGVSVTANVNEFSISLKGSVGGEQLYLFCTPDASTFVRNRVTLTTNWQRFSIAPTTTAATWFFEIGCDLRDGSQTSTGAQTIFAWGAQVELGAFPTSHIPTTSAAVIRSADVPSSSSPLTGYLAAGPSVWEFQDEATGTIARSAYAAGAFNWPVNKWYRSMGVYPSGTDTSGHMTVGSAY
jgi:hypothetical protein